MMQVTTTMMQINTAMMTRYAVYITLRVWFRYCRFLEFFTNKFNYALFLHCRLVFKVFYVTFDMSQSKRGKAKLTPGQIGQVLQIHSRLTNYTVYTYFLMM